MMATLLERPAVAGQSALPHHVASGPSPRSLSDILISSVTLAVWQRTLDVAITEEITRIDLSQVNDVRFTCDRAGLPFALAKALLDAGFHDDLAHGALASDIVTLAGQFADIIGKSLIEIRLEVVETNACHKFHADYVAARLITTYAGQGTQWLDQTDAAALVAGAPLETLTIRQLETGDVALFKGRVWSPADAIIHRSPPISGTGERRLVLVINPGREDAAIHAG